MDLKSPTTLVTARVLVPLLVTTASAGLGIGLRALSGRELRPLALPACGERFDWIELPAP